jgi:hypothetical protein
MVAKAQEIMADHRRRQRQHEGGPEHGFRRGLVEGVGQNRGLFLAACHREQGYEYYDTLPRIDWVGLGQVQAKLIWNEVVGNEK